MSGKRESEMIIGIDFDGTIPDTNTAKAAWIKRELNIELKPYECDHASCVPVIGLDNYLRMGTELYAPEPTLARPPIPGALSAIGEIGKEHSLALVTARTDENGMLPAAREWVSRYPETAAMKVVGVPIHEIAKAEVCRQQGIAFLIDDDERHIRPAVECGMGGILFKQSAPEDFRRDGLHICRSWDEIVRVLSDGQAG